MDIEPRPSRVLLDACVLYPAPLRDLLIQFATAGLFRARWTDRIHEEWITSILRNRPDLTRRQLERTRSLMDRAVLDCLVEGYETIASSLELDDPNDAHVLAAAIHAGCDVIVTFNLQGFPSQPLGRHGIEALHPDEFVLRLIDRDSEEVVHAAAACRGRLRNPPLSPQQYLAALESPVAPKDRRKARRRLRLPLTPATPPGSPRP